MKCTETRGIGWNKSSEYAEERIFSNDSTAHCDVGRGSTRCDRKEGNTLAENLVKVES